jgi:hypothetical protein
LETAKAFGAPLFAEYNPNERAKSLVESVEHRNIQYGTMRLRGNWDLETTLQLAEVGTVENAVTRMVFRR